MSSNRGRRRAMTVVATGVAVAIVLGGAVGVRSASAGTTATTTAASTAQDARRGGPGIGGHRASGRGRGTGVGSGSAATATETTRAATTAEEVGVVDVTTVLDYGTGEAAGTGIVLTSSGEILTNNHVVDEATKITVTVVGTGRAYTATVVGTDATDDVAVLQLTGASGLATATLATAAQAADVGAGDTVTAVGNAGGTGGTPTAATGTVIAVDRTITAGDETGTSSEQLTGVIEVAAAIRAGDSGGPLYSGTTVVGIDTAASSSRSDRTGTVDTAATRGIVGFAIPINAATAIADRIEAGEQSSTVEQGTPPFLGVQLSDGDTNLGSSGSGGVAVSGVVSGLPAAAAGVRAGDTITAVDGTAVDSASTLSTLLAGHHAGDRIRLSWTDPAGATHTPTVTLAAGPAA